MADLTITAANVLAGGAAIKETGIAGATITAGQTVYKDAADGKFKLADADSATAGIRALYGVALHGASNGQPLTVAKSGPVTIGATVIVGTTYVLSDTPGGIMPIGDLEAGDYVAHLGIATTAAIIDVAIKNSGVAVP